MAGWFMHPPDDWHYALELIGRILNAHDLEVRGGTGSRTNGALGSATQRVFGALATEPGAFARPVPFDRKELASEARCTETTVSKALTRLADKGMATVTGKRGAWLVQLRLPLPVFAAYETYERRFAEDCEEESLGPVSREELDRALALLDHKEADLPVARGRLTRH